MIEGTIEIQIAKNTDESLINNLLEDMKNGNFSDVKTDYDEEKGCFVINAYYEDKYIDDINKLLKSPIVNTAKADLYDNGDKSGERGDFIIKKENNKIDEEYPVFLSGVSTETLIDELSRRGISVTQKCQKNFDFNNEK